MPGTKPRSRQMEGGETEYRFSCPGCAEVLVVNRAMRDALVRRGCVVCGDEVDGDDFEPA
ncbi:MAG: DUF7560 family zinc ribbon protein [Halobacteriota archaeon]